MQVPGFGFLSYLDQSHMQNAMNELASGANDFSAKRFTPGLVRSDVIGVSGSGTSINLSLPAPFGVLFNSELFSTAHGTTAGQDTQSYSVNFSTLFPGTGSITGYVLASYAQCQQQPEVITGPPQGSPAYDPAFVPYVNYQVLRDSLALVASTGAPDNLITFEIARCTLNAGSGAVANISIEYQVAAGTQMALPKTLYSSNTVLSPSGMVGRTSIIAANGTVLTLPLSNTCVGLAFNFASSGVSGSIISQGSDTINGLYGASGVTSMPVPVNGAGMLWSTGNAWVLLSDSNLLDVGLLGGDQTWTGTNVFSQVVSLENGAYQAAISRVAWLSASTTLISGDGGTYYNVAAGVTATLPAASSTTGLTFGFFSIEACTVSVTSGGGNLYGAGLNATSVNLATADWLIVQSDGINYRVVSASPGLVGAGLLGATQTWTGANTFQGNGSGSQVVTLSDTTNTVDGVGLKMTGNGSTTPSKFMRVLSGVLQFIDSAYTTVIGSLDDSGNFTVPGDIDSTSGNINANAGKVRASTGATGSGDTNACTILGDFNWYSGSNGYQRLPSGLILQWGRGTMPSGAGGSKSQAVTFPLAFTTICFDVGVTAQGPSAGSGDFPAGSTSSAPSTTGFTAVLDNLTNTSWGYSVNYSWRAIGY